MVLPSIRKRRPTFGHRAGARSLKTCTSQLSKCSTTLQISRTAVLILRAESNSGQTSDRNGCAQASLIAGSYNSTRAPRKHAVALSRRIGSRRYAPFAGRSPRIEEAPWKLRLFSSRQRLVFSLDRDDQHQKRCPLAILEESVGTIANRYMQSSTTSGETQAPSSDQDSTAESLNTIDTSFSSSALPRNCNA